jgi:hypothetical protein
MLSKKGSVLIPLLVALILCWSNNADAGQEHKLQKLPRSFGPLYLGMSVKEFKENTGEVVIGRCVDCVEDQLQALLYIGEAPYDFEQRKQLEPTKLTDGYIKFQPKELQPREIICFFYKDALYGIVMSNVKDRFESVKSSYIKALGKPTAIDIWDSGLSQLRWEDSSTRLSVVHSTDTVGIDYFKISYTDLKIMKKILEMNNPKGVRSADCHVIPKNDWANFINKFREGEQGYYVYIRLW